MLPMSPVSTVTHVSGTDPSAAVARFGFRTPSHLIGSGRRIRIVPVRARIVLKAGQPVEREVAFDHDAGIEALDRNVVLAGLPDNPVLSPSEVQQVENLGRRAQP